MNHDSLSETIAVVAETSRRIAPDMVAMRRAMHRRPERRLRLPETQKMVLDGLAGIPLEITLGDSLDSVAAVLRGDPQGPTVLLRADMDALPINEESGEDFSSENDLMHACGHDLHTAALVGAARSLAELGPLPGTILFMFQPGEEDPGGAKIMLEEGILQRAGQTVDAAYGIHITSAQRGQFSTRRGAMLAGVSDLRITVHGEGGHGSSPHMAIDPVSVAAEIVGALQTYITRRIYVFDPVVMNVGQMQTEGPLNAIPATAHLGVSVRTFSAASLEQLRAEVPRLVHGIASAYGCTAELDFKLSCPVTYNDPEVTSGTIADLEVAFGAARVDVMEHPGLISEDFSYILEQVPGTFVTLGACPPELDYATAPTNHSNRVRFDDSVLADQATALATMALGGIARLARGESA